MLTNTFVHIQGIGAITEQRLWDSGLRDWESFFYKSHLIEEPTLPRNPFSADLGTVDNIKNSPKYLLPDQWYRHPIGISPEANQSIFGN